MITTPTPDDLVALLARHWSIEAPTLTVPARGTNNLMRLVHTGDRLVGVLRVYRNLDHDRVLREHRLLRRLASAGLPYRVPRPLPTGDGATLIDSPWGTISLSDWIEGGRPELARPAAGRAAGRALAELDRALAGVPASEAPFDWLGSDLGLAALDADLVAALEMAGLPDDHVAWLRDRLEPPTPPTGLPTQLIHCDLAASNLLAGDDHQIVGILDFEVAGRDLRINDLAIFLTLSGILDHDDWPAKTAALVGGYAEVIIPDPGEIMIIPSLIAARTLGSIGWRATRWRTGLSPLEEVAHRVAGARQTERWLDRHADHLLDVLHRGFAVT